MRVVIRFDRRDDLSIEYRNNILAMCMPLIEERWAEWIGHELTFSSDRTPQEVLEGFEEGGFAASEFESIAFFNQ